MSIIAVILSLSFVCTVAYNAIHMELIHRLLLIHMELMIASYLYPHVFGPVVYTISFFVSSEMEVVEMIVSPPYELYIYIYI